MLIESIMHPALFVCLVLVAALVLFMTEVIPVIATAMLVSLSLCLGGVISAKTAISSFASDNIMIMAGLGIIGEALFKTGAAAKFGILLEKVAKSERMLVFFLVLGSGVLAGFLNVSGSAALLISIALGICQSTSYRRCKMMYPIAVGCTLGGGITTVGSSSTLYLQDLLSGMGLKMKFFELAPISFILLLVGGAFLATIGFSLMPNSPNNEDQFSFSGAKTDYSQIPKWKPTFSTCVLAITIVLMYFSSNMDWSVSVGIIALIAAFFVIASRVISDKEAIRAIPMKAIIMYSFLVPISTAMENSGASQILADFLGEHAGGIISPLLVIVVVFLVATPLTNIMSNAATIIMLCPITLAVCQSLGMNPISALMTVRMGGTLALFTPLGVPPMTMAMEPGGYSFKDYLKPGIPLTLICMVICTIYFYFAYPLFL